MQPNGEVKHLSQWRGVPRHRMVKSNTSLSGGVSQDTESYEETGTEIPGSGGRFIYLCIYLLLAYSPVNRSGSPQGFSQVQISHTS